jgi:hypothetical protein
MATIKKDVAQQAKPSITTLSHVINGIRYVNDGLPDWLIPVMLTPGKQPGVFACSLLEKQVDG